MCTYLKNMEGYKLKDLKSKGFDSIQEMFDIAFKRQKVEDDKETAELKQRMEINPDDEEVAIDAIPLAVKSPITCLKVLTRKMVKAKYESTRPVEDLDLVLWNDLKTMFEPHVEDKVWKNQQDYKVLSWKLYDSCGVHFLRMQHVKIYMLVEKKYPLTPSILTMMLEKKLMIDYETGFSAAHELQRKYAKYLLLLVQSNSEWKLQERYFKLEGWYLFVISPVTDAKIQAVERKMKVRTMFGGNANSKKMQKAVFKQQFEAFTISTSEGLEKGYDIFQQLLSQLEAHGAEVSTEDANHKFLRSLPPAWSNWQ
ncbi:hypothetical protein Tco_0831827 [Tanacetum coccineum]